MELIIILLLSAIGAQAIRFNIHVKKAFVSKHDLFPAFVPSLVPTIALKQLSQCAGRTAKFTGDYHLREQHELNPSGTTAR